MPRKYEQQWEALPKVTMRKKQKRHRRRKKILSAYIMHRMQVTEEKQERNL